MEKSSKIPIFKDGTISLIEVATKNKCAICFNKLYSVEIVQKLCCGHFFHSKCISGALRDPEEKTFFCPCCRKVAVIHTSHYLKEEHDKCSICLGDDLDPYGQYAKFSKALIKCLSTDNLQNEYIKHWFMSITDDFKDFFSVRFSVLDVEFFIKQKIQDLNLKRICKK